MTFKKFVLFFSLGFFKYINFGFSSSFPQKRGVGRACFYLAWAVIFSFSTERSWEGMCLGHKTDLSCVFQCASRWSQSSWQKNSSNIIKWLQEQSIFVSVPSKTVVPLLLIWQCYSSQCFKPSENSKPCGVRNSKWVPLWKQIKKKLFDMCRTRQCYVNCILAAEISHEQQKNITGP